MASQSGEQQGVDLMTLPPQQLAQIKEQLEGQIEQFSVNFQDLQVGGSLEISLFPERENRHGVLTCRSSRPPLPFQMAIQGFHSSGLAIEDLNKQKEGA